MFSALQLDVILLACCAASVCPPNYLKVRKLQNVEYNDEDITVCQEVDRDDLQNKPEITSTLYPGKFILVMVEHPRLNTTHSQLHWMAHVEVEDERFYEGTIHFDYIAPQTEGINQIYVIHLYKDESNLISAPTDVIDLDKLEIDNNLELNAYFAFVAQNNTV